VRVGRAARTPGRPPRVLRESAAPRARFREADPSVKVDEGRGAGKGRRVVIHGLVRNPGERTSLPQPLRDRVPTVRVCARPSGDPMPTSVPGPGRDRRRAVPSRCERRAWDATPFAWIPSGPGADVSWEPGPPPDIPVPYPGHADSFPGTAGPWLGRSVTPGARSTARPAGYLPKGHDWRRRPVSQLVSGSRWGRITAAYGYRGAGPTPANNQGGGPLRPTTHPWRQDTVVADCFSSRVGMLNETA
jgi:hypothetical protein